MAVFIELEFDTFAKGGVAEEEVTLGTANMPVRRPLRGIQIKPDTYAYFRIIDKYGKSIPVLDAGGVDNPAEPGTGVSERYTNFLVQAVSQSSSEKYQIVPTFGDPFIFFYGTQPRIYQVSGLLMNTFDFRWATEFWYNYNKYLSGTKCAENKAKIFFYCDGQLWEGYLLQCQANRTADNPNLVPFSFAIFVTREYITEPVGETAFPQYPGSQDNKGTEGLWGKIQTGVELALDSTAATMATFGMMRSIATGSSAGFVENLSASLGIGLDIAFKFMNKGVSQGRGKIRDNWDEYVGIPDPEFGTPWWVWLKMGISWAAAAMDMSMSLEAMDLLGGPNTQAVIQRGTFAAEVATAW
uniref:Uncharacterized protein n=1 Tax=Dictyoglomus turgidum TaxID=513050 RepID=A0A7C3WXM8_9BACT